MTNLTRSIRRLLLHEDGATMVEYALILSLIVIGCLGLISQIGNAAFQFLNIGSSF